MDGAVWNASVVDVSSRLLTPDLTTFFDIVAGASRQQVFHYRSASPQRRPGVEFAFDDVDPFQWMAGLDREDWSQDS